MRIGLGQMSPLYFSFFAAMAMGRAPMNGLDGTVEGKLADQKIIIEEILE